MKIQGIPGITTDEELARHVAERGCFDATENARIYKKWFTGQRPRDTLYKYIDDKLGITNTMLVDVGCGYGPTLVHAAPGSYGIDVEERQAAFGRSIGLTIHTRNIITDDLSDLPPADTLWCAATLEHVDAPHIFLRRLFYLLKPNGRLVLEVPCALPAMWMRVIPGAKHVYGDHDDHINSFSAPSLARFCERAGFAEDWVFRYSTPLINRGVPVWLTRVPPFNLVAESIVFVGRAIPNWNYPPKSSRRAANNLIGYRSKSQYSTDPNDPGEERRY